MRFRITLTEGWIDYLLSFTNHHFCYSNEWHFYKEVNKDRLRILSVFIRKSGEVDLYDRIVDSVAC